MGNAECNFGMQSTGHSTDMRHSRKKSCNIRRTPAGEAETGWGWMEGGNMRNVRIVLAASHMRGTHSYVPGDAL